MSASVSERQWRDSLRRQIRRVREIRRKSWHAPMEEEILRNMWARR